MCSLSQVNGGRKTPDLNHNGDCTRDGGLPVGDRPGGAAVLCGPRTFVQKVAPRSSSRPTIGDRTPNRYGQRLRAALQAVVLVTERAYKKASSGSRSHPSWKRSIITCITGQHRVVGCNRAGSDDHETIGRLAFPSRARLRAGLGEGRPRERTSRGFRCRAHWERRRSFGRTSCAPAIETSRFALD